MKLAFKLMVPKDINRLDPFAAPVPFREELYEQVRANKIRVGYLESISSFPTTEAVKRSVRMAKEALESQGYELVPFVVTAEEMESVRDTFFGIIATAALGPMMGMLIDKYEYPMPCYKLSVLLY